MASVFSRCLRAHGSEITASLLRSSTKAVARPAYGGLIQRRYLSASVSFSQRRYTESHEWIDVGADGKTCTIGISKYAAEALGDVVYVELPSIGDETTDGEAFGVVESVKSASDINSPVSGTVVEVNEPLNDSPANVGKDPEGEAWLIKVEAADVSGIEALMDEGAYAKHTHDK